MADFITKARRSIVRKFSELEEVQFYRDIADKEPLKQGKGRPLDGSLTAGAKVLDVGWRVVEGRPSPLIRRGLRVTAIDLIHAMAKQTSQNTKVRRLEANCVQNDAQNLCFSAGVFDIVSHEWCGYPIHPGKMC